MPDAQHTPIYYLKRAVKYLSEHPGATTQALLTAVYGADLVHPAGLRTLLFGARQHGYGITTDGLWYLMDDNDDVKAQVLQAYSPDINEAIDALHFLQTVLGATHIGFNPASPQKKEP